MKIEDLKLQVIEAEKAGASAALKYNQELEVLEEDSVEEEQVQKTITVKKPKMKLLNTKIAADNTSSAHDSIISAPANAKH